MDFLTILGLTAGTMTTGSVVPQVIKTFQTRNTKGISFLMYTISWIGAVLWTIYGFCLNNIILIVFNSISVCLISIMLVLKTKYK
jgi:MtN3 and saliva related transmembrane protein